MYVYINFNDYFYALVNYVLDIKGPTLSTGHSSGNACDTNVNRGLFVIAKPNYGKRCL
jgi:hypothetical protein